MDRSIGGESMTYEKIKERYMKRYIRDDQLARFVELKVITQEEADSIVRHFSELKRGGGVSLY